MNNLNQYKSAIEEYKKRIMDLNIESRNIIRDFETIKTYKNHKSHNNLSLVQEFEVFIHSTIIKFMKKLDISENTFKQILPMYNDYKLIIEQCNYYKNEYEKYRNINATHADENNKNNNTSSSSSLAAKKKRSLYQRFQSFKYNVNICNIETNITTQQLANQLVKVLNEEQISLNLFAKRVLGVSRVVASKLVSNPRTWPKLPKPTVKHFKIIYMWLNDEQRIEKLKKFMRKVQIVPDTNAALQADLARQLLPNINTPTPPPPPPPPTTTTTTTTTTTPITLPIKPTPIYKSQPINEPLCEKPQLTRQQTSYLNNYYQTNPIPTHDEIADISHNLNIDENYVKKWFENMKINDCFSINNNQLELLQQVYLQDKRPSTQIIGKLSLQTGLSIQTINNWFLSQDDIIDDSSNDTDDNDSVIEIPFSD